jgi:hypothetical protein
MNPILLNSILLNSTRSGAAGRQPEVGVGIGPLVAYRMAFPRPAGADPADIPAPFR